MSDVLVRPVIAADREAWAPLWDGYNAFYERTGPTAVSAEQTELTWSRFLDAGEPMHALLAEVDGRVVGLTHYLFHRSTTMVGDTCYLQDLFTAPEARGTGVGRALIEAVYAAARDAGSTRVYWQTHETNLTAQKLYDAIADRSGFIVYRHDVAI
jgi:GNAT superfamily N-acetyltransferase